MWGTLRHFGIKNWHYKCLIPPLRAGRPSNTDTCRLALAQFLAGSDLHGEAFDRRRKPAHAGESGSAERPVLAVRRENRHQVVEDEGIAVVQTPPRPLDRPGLINPRAVTECGGVAPGEHTPALDGIENSVTELGGQLGIETGRLHCCFHSAQLRSRPAKVSRSASWMFDKRSQRLQTLRRPGRWSRHAVHDSACIVRE